MNTYYKFAPNVFLAKCDEKHEKGETIEVTTKYGKENECIVFNLIYERDGFYYYSIVRADGFNVQEWAKQRAERRHEWATSAVQKSCEYYNKSNKDKDFLSLGEPIKVGHHSEKRHRKALLDRVSCWCCGNKNLKELKNMYLYLPWYWKKLKELQLNTDRPYRRNSGETIFDLEERFKREMQ